MPINYDDFEKIACNALEEFSRTEFPQTLEEKAFTEEYCILKKWFQDLCVNNKWTPDKIRIGALAIYGWMPTMLRVYGIGPLNASDNNFPNFDVIAGHLNCGSIDNIEKNFLNRSYVGTSKFLHLCFPEKIAIWDRNVCFALGWGKNANNTQRFEKYQSFIGKFSKEHGKTLRLVELALFERGRVMLNPNQP